MEASTIGQIIEYVWIPIVTALILLWRKFGGIDTRTQLLEQATEFFKNQRIEDRKLRDEQRREILSRGESHHKVVMDKLDSMESRIKNGR